MEYSARATSSVAQNGRIDVPTTVAVAQHRKQDPKAGQTAVAELLEAFRPTLEAAAKSWRWPGMGEADLQQEAAIGLLRAIDSYSEGRGPFAPWLWLWLRHCCTRAGRAASKDLAVLVSPNLWRDLANKSVGDMAIDDLVVDQLDLDSRRSAVVRAVQSLPAELRDAALRPGGGQIERRRRVLAMLRHPSVRSLLARPDDSARFAGCDSAVIDVVPAVRGGDAALDRLAARLAEIGIPAPKGAWLTRAACTGMSPEVFFSAQADNRTRALATCSTCPVTAECVLDALNRPDRGGVRAGTVEKQRRVLKRMVDQRRTLL